MKHDYNLSDVFATHLRDKRSAYIKNRFTLIQSDLVFGVFATASGVFSRLMVLWENGFLINLWFSSGACLYDCQPFSWMDSKLAKKLDMILVLDYIEITLGFK